ncbi:MAG TPA: alpha/beta hydrolase [Bryobacteraceae bacterium]|nr:alpha/beta hydrolase [Bryobacteraceae bacterium]
MRLDEGYVITEDGVRLFYQKLGSGPNTVIVPNAVHMFDSFQHLSDHRTVIFFDLRNRGRSDSVGDSAKLIRGIHRDVDDLEAVRRHFGIDKTAAIGHSYVALTVILYALKYPAHVSRLVQIGPPPPNAQTQYPAHLTGADQTLTEFVGKLTKLQKERESETPQEFCRKFWELIRVLYVANPADAPKIRWAPCDYPNEYLHFMKHWTGNVLPSIQALDLRPEELSKVKAQVLTIHGTRDRQAPYGGGREWASILPDARLVTVEDAAHVPWIEAPEKVFGAIKAFLDGAWPGEAESEIPQRDPIAGRHVL